MSKVTSSPIKLPLSQLALVTCAPLRTPTAEFAHHPTRNFESKPVVLKPFKGVLLINVGPIPYSKKRGRRIGLPSSSRIRKLRKASNEYITPMFKLFVYVPSRV